MGCCKSCFAKDDDDIDENSPLLPDNGRSLEAADPVSMPYGLDENTPVGSLVISSKHDEHSILDGIISHYNNEVIDITAFDAKINAMDYMNRVQTYNRKLNNVLAGIQSRPSSNLIGVADPIQVLATTAISEYNVQLISKYSQLCSIAVEEDMKPITGGSRHAMEDF